MCARVGSVSIVHIAPNRKQGQQVTCLSLHHNKIEMKELYMNAQSQ